MKVDPKQCAEMMSSQIFTYNNISYPLLIGRINELSYQKTGTITFSGSNFYCTGGTQRLKNGLYHNNMLSTVHLRIGLLRVDVTRQGGNIIIPGKNHIYPAKVTRI